jgi:hypothetical protein
MRLREVTIDSITVMDPLGFKQVFPKPQRGDIAVSVLSNCAHYMPDELDV